MELTAVIEGLKALKYAKGVKIYSDSQYVCSAFNRRWVDNWARNGFRTREGKPVKNQELWMELISLVNKYNPQFTWVRGHNGLEYNEKVDKLAVSMSRRYADGEKP